MAVAFVKHTLNCGVKFKVSKLHNVLRRTGSEELLINFDPLGFLMCIQSTVHKNFGTPPHRNDSRSQEHDLRPHSQQHNTIGTEPLLRMAFVATRCNNAHKTICNIFVGLIVTSSSEENAETWLTCQFSWSHMGVESECTKNICVLLLTSMQKLVLHGMFFKTLSNERASVMVESRLQNEWLGLWTLHL